MIRTTRSRLEIRQDPGGATALAGSALMALGAAAALSALIVQWSLPQARSRPWVAACLGAALLCVLAGRFLLRRHSRVIVDLDHRMVARYAGPGAGPLEGNRSWDLSEFAAVVLVRRERRRLISGASWRADSVCLRRPDGLDLEIYRARDAGDGAQIAQSVARFIGLPYLG